MKISASGHDENSTEYADKSTPRLHHCSIHALVTLFFNEQRKMPHHNILPTMTFLLTLVTLTLDLMTFDHQLWIYYSGRGVLNSETHSTTS